MKFTTHSMNETLKLRTTWKRMTRVNSGVKPSDLPIKLLGGEHHEIIRIPGLVKKVDRLIEIPRTFTLGTGHVKFFYDKMAYLLARYRAVYNALINEGYDVQDWSYLWDDIPSDMMGGYRPTAEGRAILIERYREGGYEVGGELYPL